MATSPDIKNGPSNPEASTSLLAGRHARASVWQAYGEEWLTPEGTSPLSFSDLQTILNRAGFYGKMCRGSLQALADGTSEVSSLAWQSWGIVYRGEYSMHKISESRSDAVVSSLSLTLERGNLPQRFFLSPKACAGILRRANRRGKALPELLEKALKETADKLPTSLSEETTDESEE
jgi:hypothetical protein